MLSASHPEHVTCISATSFSFDVGIIRESTVEKLKVDPRPPFGTKVSSRPSSKASKLNEQFNQKHKASTPSPTKKPSESSVTPSSATSFKPKEAYSPSKSFFSYEMGGVGTTSASEINEKILISNEIPVDEISKEEEEKAEKELNEIIKELKSDEEAVDGEKDVGELKTREVNMTSENGEENSENSHSNDTSTDAKAVKSSKTTMNSNFILISISSILFCKYFT
ncbi:uncharacterized protein CELE_C06E7.2 [Caenorhabditis elegans]|nr:Uncharacterized protein CELE_C06E7.2 [Caenorhabditis elegans]CDK13317.1 Uncharacterized protein CELE_C06E7.2 [Caenorhabditis elegans]|eukprot:NP_001293681.1 Uncharacterized protein CELE_C06E7.2 [Caenorhabditis elegans]